jgi:hypothetical protein
MAAEVTVAAEAVTAIAPDDRSLVWLAGWIWSAPELTPDS